MPKCIKETKVIYTLEMNSIEADWLASYLADAKEDESDFDAKCRDLIRGAIKNPERC